MSCGTTLTLYKKYNLKMDDAEFDALVQKYAEHGKSTDSWRTSGDIPLSEYAKDLPIAMELDPFRQDGRYDEETKSWIDTRPPRTLETVRASAVGHVDSRDRMYCGKMMEWDFGSSFDCLLSHFSIASYSSLKDSVVEISEAEASKMLVAIDYILGEDWSDKVADAMDNPYIYLFTQGYRCDSYWKYVYRNRACKGDVISVSKRGYDITIKCPHKDPDGEDDDMFSGEIEESNATIRSNLCWFRNGLVAFLESDRWSRTDGSEWMGDGGLYRYMLTYEFWG